MDLIRQSFISYRLKNISSFLLLQELEQKLGITKAFKFYWAFLTNCSQGEAIEMNKEIKKSLKKMTFRDPKCVLSRCSSYREAVYEVCLTLHSFLKENINRIQPTTEVRMNALISSLHSYSLSHLLQARPLPHLVSTTSLYTLRPLLFSSGESLQKALRSADIDDLIVILILFTVALAKCSDSTSTTSPGFRGLEWLRDKALEFDLSWLPMAKKDRVPTFDGKAQYTLTEEFPAIVPQSVSLGQVNIQEMMAAEALEKKKKSEEAKRLNPNQFSIGSSNGPMMGLKQMGIFGTTPFFPPFGPGYKIPLMDTTKPLSKLLVVNTLPVNPFQNQSTTFNSGAYEPYLPQQESFAPIIDEEPIDNGIPIFKKQKKKK